MIPYCGRLGSGLLFFRRRSFSVVSYLPLFSRLSLSPSHTPRIVDVLLVINVGSSGLLGSSVCCGFPFLAFLPPSSCNLFFSPPRRARLRSRRFSKPPTCALPSPSPPLPTHTASSRLFGLQDWSEIPPI